MRIKELREQKGILQKSMADDLNIGRTTLCQYENGKRQPDFDTLQRIADYFDVTIDYLLNRSNKKRSPLIQTSTGLIWKLLIF